MPDTHDALLAMHAGAGTVALALGPVVLSVRRRESRRRLVRAYHWAVLAVALTAIGLVSLDPDVLWWLAPLAVFAYACVLAGLCAPLRSIRLRLHGFGGSYISLVTALLVVSIDGPATAVAWIAPTLVGLILIERAVARDFGALADLRAA